MWIDSVVESPYAGRVWWTRMPPVRTVVANLSRELPVVLLILVAALVTRFHLIDADSVWLDEVTTYHRARLNIGRLIADSELHHHNPTYFLFMHAWLKLGDNEVMLRAPSAVFGALTVLGGYLLGRIAGGRWVATATAVVLLLNPALVAYSQEARMYAMSTFAAVVAMAGLLWLVVHPAEAVHPFLRRWWRSEGGSNPWSTLAWLACSFGWVLVLYLHGTGVLFVLACSVVALVRLVASPVDRLRFAASYTVANLLSLLAFGPWLVRLFGQAEAVKDKYWAVFPTPARGAYEIGTAFLFGNDPWRWVVVIALAVAGSYTLRRQRLLVASLWSLALLGPTLLLLASVWKPMFMHRLILWAAVPFGVLVGAGFAAPALPAVRVAMLALALFFGGWALNAEYYEPFRKEPWRQAIQFLHRRVKPADRVLAFSYSVKQILEYHFGRTTQPVKRFRYDVASKPRNLPDAGPRRVLWVLSRQGHKRMDLLDGLAARDWREVEKKNLGKGIAVRRFVPARGRPVRRQESEPLTE
jgi:mannosyltransferase